MSAYLEVKEQYVVFDLQPEALEGSIHFELNNDQFWIFKRVLHRTDGPAFVGQNGRKEWWLYGVRYDPLEWMLKVHELGLK